MAFNDLEFHAVNKEVKLFIESMRPPEHLRGEFDIVYIIANQTIDIGEQRQVWRGKPGETRVHPSARIVYMRTLKLWRIFWMRRDMKWHLYDAVETLTEALEIVRIDPNGCFFG